MAKKYEMKLPYDTVKEISFYSEIFASVIKTVKIN